MKLTVHMVVKNEDLWIWYAVNSVLPYAEQIFIYDTGSSDKTVEIIKSLKSPKIFFEEKGLVDGNGLVELRREQLDRTKTEWFLILDGDEIWSNKELEKLLEKVNRAPENTIALFNNVRNCIGDIYHYLPEKTGNYKIGNKVGNLNIRLIKKTPNLKISGEYPLEVYADRNGPIQSQVDKVVFADCWYLHTSFLKRSSGDVKKVSGSFGKSRVWQKGLPLNMDQLPEVLFSTRPDLVKSPFKKRGFAYEIVASVLTPLLDLKRVV